MTRILILWLLSEGPLHGYRIQQILSTPAFAFWFRIEDAAIYSMLRTLVKRGFARLDGEEQVGNRPQRTLYRITPDGRAELRRRLEAAWGLSEDDKDPVCAALAAADEFEKVEIQGFLAARRAQIENRAESLRALEKAAPSSLLARRTSALLAAERAWIERELTGETEEREDQP